MKLKKIEPEAKKEMLQEKIEKSKSILKEKITEIKQAKRTLAKLEKQYKELLEKDVDEIEVEQPDNNQVVWGRLTNAQGV